MNNWKWPAVPGLHTFKGKLLHSANWDETYDYKVKLTGESMMFRSLHKSEQGQRVAVIGNGSSGIQVVPGMLPDVEHIDHYVRRGTWLSPTFGRELLDMRGESRDNGTNFCLHAVYHLSLLWMGPLTYFCSSRVLS